MSNKILINSREFEPAEWETRCNLAACHRLVVKNNWDELNNSHITARVPGTEDQFLIAPHELHFNEISASNFIKMDMQGNPVEETDVAINPAALHIHLAIYEARKNVQCIMHTHTTAGAVVSAQKEGLRPISQQSLLFYERCAYHDFQGIFLDPDEKQSLIKNLGDKDILFLRNHGLLACASNLPKVFAWIFFLEKACEIQIAAQATGESLLVPSESVCKKTVQQVLKFADRDPIWWPGLIRDLEKSCPEYKE